MNKTPARVGIIGFGPVSAARTFHVPLIGVQPALQLHQVSSLLPLDELKPLLPTGVQLTADSADIINNPDIDLVVIATPIPFHFDLAKQALQAGKHVVVEKPITMSVSETDQLIALAKEKNLLLSQHHNRRWDAGFLTVQKLIADGAFGAIASYEAAYDRWVPEAPQSWQKPMKPGTGILYDLGVHLIDQTLALFGRPYAVTATLRAQRPNAEADDYFYIQLDYGQLQVTLHASMLAAVPAPRYKVLGSKGTFVKYMASYGSDPQANMLNDGMLPADKGWGQDIPEAYGSFHDGTAEKTIPSEPGAYQKFYEGIAAALANGVPQPVPVEDARDGIAIIEAAMTSDAQGRTVKADEISFLIPPEK